MRELHSLKAQLELIKQQVNPKDEHIRMAISFGPTNEPHGFMCGRIFHIMISRGKETRYIEALDEETELGWAKQSYDLLVKSGYPFSFAEYVERLKCTCGKHGFTGREPFGKIQYINT